MSSPIHHSFVSPSTSLCNRLPSSVSHDLPSQQQQQQRMEEVDERQQHQYIRLLEEQQQQQQKDEQQRQAPQQQLNHQHNGISTDHPFSAKPTRSTLPRCNHTKIRISPSSCISICHLILLLLLLSSIQHPGHDRKDMGSSSFLFVSAYSNGAGSCPGGMNALTNVSDHLDDNKGVKAVSSLKQGFNRFGIDVFINGTAIDVSSSSSSSNATTTSPTITLIRGETYYFQLVANKYPFKGFLMRLDYDNNIDPNNVKTLDVTPYETQDTSRAKVCQLPAMGVTHKDNTNKTNVGGIVTFGSLGKVSVDITVVFSNTNTESSFAYASIKNILIATRSNATTTTTTNTTTTIGSGPVPSPVAAAANGLTPTPTITWYPTITTPPTFSDRCYVCNATDRIVIRPTKSFTFLSIVTTCGDVYETGLKGYIPPNVCPAAQAAMKDNRCGCVAVTPAPIIPTLPPIPTAAPIIIPPSPAPIITTSSPTFGQKCYLCGDSAKMISLPYAIVTLPSQQQFTCQQLQDVSMSGRASPTLCQAFQTAVLANNICQCQYIPTPAPVIPPFITPVNTISSNPCFTCSNANQLVASRSRNASFSGLTYSCGQLYDVQPYIDYTDSSCYTYTETMKTQCGCLDSTYTNNAPSPSSTGGLATPITFAPTVTPPPTITAGPTYVLSCPICDNPNDVIFNRDDTVLVLNRLYTCNEIFNGGVKHQIPPNYCPYFQSAAQGKCFCISADQYNNTNPSVSSRSSADTIYTRYYSVLLLSAMLLSAVFITTL